MTQRDSFTIYMCVGGKVEVSTEFGSVQISKGETTLVPANANIITLSSDNAKLLEVTI